MKLKCRTMKNWMILKMWEKMYLKWWLISFLLLIKCF